MSSSTSPDNQTVGYPSLPAPSAPSPEDNATSNDTNERAQIAVEGASGNLPNDSLDQANSTGRQLRSSGPAQNISVGSLVSDQVTPEERQNEIDRIVNGGPDQALSNYHVGTSAEMTQIYKSLSMLVHPDKQTGEVWKGRATRAQQILNEARDKFAAPEDVPEPEIGRVKPGDSHKRLWNLPRFVGTVRRLHIDPDQETAIAIVNATNERIETINNEEGLPSDCGKFPLRYLQYNYKEAHKMLKNYTESNDAELKANSTILFKSFSEATNDFCVERGLPSTWAWDCDDISRLPAYLEQYAQAENPANQEDAMDLSADNGHPISPISQPAATQSAATQPDFTQSNDSDNNDSDNQTILFKRNVFRCTQYLVKDRSGLHVWKREDECDVEDADQIPFITKPDRSFIRDRKRQYKGIGWIAMADGESITVGVGQSPFPPITLNVIWRDNEEDTPLWRSDVIKLVGLKRVEKDMQMYLPYTKTVEYESQKILVMSPTADGLLGGEPKAIERIQKQQAKLETTARLAASTSAQAGVAMPMQPAVMESSTTQSTVSQPAPAPQPATVQPAVGQQGSVQPASTQTAVPQPAPTQPLAPQPMDLQNVMAQMQMLLQQCTQLMSQQTQPVTAAQ